jgi:hypothetical protein
MAGISLQGHVRATPSQTILLALERVDISLDFDLFHYFLTNLDGSAYLPSYNHQQP